MLPRFESDQEEFARVLHANISPTHPVQSEEHLYGREKQIRQIGQALFAPGRSIFIYGDRGVGKTSLADTVAFSRQSSARSPVLLACHPTATFSSVMQHAIDVLKTPESRQPSEKTIRAKFILPIKAVPLGIDVAHTTKHGEARQNGTLDLNDAVETMLRLSEKLPADETDVVVLDEFDRIDSDVERTHFADFIKQIGDKGIAIRFVFCGVADSLQKLLGAHGSCYRYIEGVELQRLSWEARFEIIDNAAKALGVTIGDRPRMRIASISDGFPHYIHLICEKMFWHMFNDPASCDVPTIDHYREAVTEAVLGIEQHLKATYDRAVATSAHEEILWAMADHRDFSRSSESVYDSYVQLFGGVLNSGDDAEPLLERGQVTMRLNAMKGRSRGCILSSVNDDRKGWYRFTESIMRGYVRLRAEEQGLELAQDYNAVGGGSVNQAYPVRGARRSKGGVARATWEKTKGPSGY